MIMTQDKALKAAIRARMAETDEPYSVARNAILSDSVHGGERGESTAPPQPSPAHDPGEDYYDRYLREAREAGVSEDELAEIDARQRARDQADRARAAAELAEQRAEQAEETADQAEERAERAQEAAEAAEELANEAVVSAARERAGRRRAQAEDAREVAERAREQAEAAGERADRAEEYADLVSDGPDDDADGDGGHWASPGGDEDGDQRASSGWSPDPGRSPKPPRPPRPPRPMPPRAGRPWAGSERFLTSLDDLERQFDDLQGRAATFLNRLRGDHDRDDS
jgi:hypothetical protein